MKNKFLIFTAFFCSTLLSYAQPGQIDSAFGKHGLVKKTLPIQLRFNKLAFQTDKKIIAAGYINTGAGIGFIVVRYNTDGKLDKSFSDDGIQTTGFGTLSDYAYSVAIQNDGKIVVAGTGGINTSAPTTFAIARYNSNGNLDSSFSGDGKQTLDFGYYGSSASSVAIQTDGKILVKGVVLTNYNDNNPNNPYLALARLNGDGSLDSSFSNDGKVTGDQMSEIGGAVAIQKNGKIIAGGSDIVYSYNSDGSPDNTFGVNGKVYSGFRIADLTLTPDEKIVTAGGTGSLESSAFAIARYNINGSVDSTFNGNGITTTFFPDYAAEAKSVISQSDGKIIAGGYLYTTTSSGDFLIAAGITRYNTDGSIDSTFANGAGIISPGAVLRNISVSNNRLYSTGDINNNSGFVARYFIDSNKAPAVRITTPVNNQQITGPAAIHLQASATDSGDAIAKVAFYNGSDLLHTETESPYIYNWKNVRVGNYVLTAVATDERGLATRSAVVYISVVPNKAPAVSITSPANGENFSAPATIALVATASDSDGTISKVEFYKGQVWIGVKYFRPYIFNWKNVSAGTYSITAKATDNLGAQTISDAVTIKVKVPNKAPVVTITSPADNSVFGQGAAVHINATASDADGQIASVVLLNGTKSYGTQQDDNNYYYIIKNAQPGRYSFTAKATDNKGAETISNTVRFSVKAISSKPYTENEKIAQNNALSLRLAPNPAGNIVNIQTSGLQPNKPATLSIISVSGIVLKTMQISKALTQLDVSTLASGVYTIKIISGDKVIHKQFVKL